MTSVGAPEPTTPVEASRRPAYQVLSLVGPSDIVFAALREAFTAAADGGCLLVPSPTGSGGEDAVLAAAPMSCRAPGRAGEIQTRRPARSAMTCTFSWVASLLDVRPTDRVLEIGFGPGLAIAELSRRGGPCGHVYGIDHSDVMLRQATKRNAAAIQAGRVTLTLGTVEQLPPALDGPFDAILAVNSLGFWTAPAERLEDLRRRLRPGGRLAIASQPRCPGATRSTSLDAASGITALLRAAGFIRARTEILDLDPPVVCVLAVNHAPAHGRPPDR